MKSKFTRKEIKENYNIILEVGYCNLQNLLKYKEPFGYSTRAEGWACDYYELNNGVCVSTGYAPIGKGKQVSKEVFKKYDDKARKLLDRYNYPIGRINTLINKFVNEILEED